MADESHDVLGYATSTQGAHSPSSTSGTAQHTANLAVQSNSRMHSSGTMEKSKMLKVTWVQRGLVVAATVRGPRSFTLSLDSVRAE